MGVGENSAAWAELADGVTADDDQLRRSREGEPLAEGASLESQSDWVLLFAFTAIMTIPFALVAWLLS